MTNPDQFKFIKKYINKRPNHYDIIINENELQNDYGVEGMCTDAILHKPNCFWHIIESKGTNIDKAIMQFENTLEKLNGKNINGIDFHPKLLIIIAKKLTNSRKWRKSRKGHFLKDPNIRDPERSKIRIKGLYIKLIYQTEILGRKKFPIDFDLLEID